MTRPASVTPELTEIIDRIRALRAHTKRTGFRTTRSENEILSRLSADDLATVLLALETSDGGAQ
jgi:hypothetical protein